MNQSTKCYQFANLLYFIRMIVSNFFLVLVVYVDVTSRNSHIYNKSFSSWKVPKFS